MANYSIHPRVEGGRQVHPKSNTMRRPNPDVVMNKIAAIEEHLKRHPTDLVSKRHVELLNKRL